LIALINLCLGVKTFTDIEDFLDRLFCFRYRAMREWHSFAPIVIPVEI